MLVCMVLDNRRLGTNVSLVVENYPVGKGSMKRRKDKIRDEGTPGVGNRNMDSLQALY